MEPRDQHLVGRARGVGVEALHGRGRVVVAQREPPMAERRELGLDEPATEILAACTWRTSGCVPPYVVLRRPTHRTSTSPTATGSTARRRFNRTSATRPANSRQSAASCVVGQSEISPRSSARRNSRPKRIAP